MKQTKQINNLQEVWKKSEMWRRAENFTLKKTMGIDEVLALNKPIFVEIWGDIDATLFYLDEERLRVIIVTAFPEDVEGQLITNALAEKYAELENTLVRKVPFGSDRADELRQEMRELVTVINNG